MQVAEQSRCMQVAEQSRSIAPCTNSWALQLLQVIVPGAHAAAAAPDADGFVDSDEDEEV